MTTIEESPYDPELMAAVTELGTAIRELVDASVRTTVGPAELRAAAEGVRTATAALAVARRGGPARGALLVVTLLFLVLAGGSGLANTRWTAALVLCGVAAAVMTGRLRHAPREGLAVR